MRLGLRFDGHEMDLTKGNLFKKMPKFVLPLILTTTFQLLYTTVDLWTVSTFGGGPTSMAAIGSNGALINLILTVLISLATGANVVISSAKGARNREKAEKTLHTAFIIALLGGIVFALIGYFGINLGLRLMDTPASIIDKATAYLQVYFLGVPFLMIYNFGSQMLRALGDSKRPLFILIISGIINVILDFICVKYLNLDVIGVALATIASELVSASLVIIWFRFNKESYVNFSWKKLKIDNESLKEILKIGLPAGLQGMAFCFPNVVIQSSLYTIDNYFINGVLINQEEIVAGAAAAAQIESYVFVLIDSFAVGLISFVGQNYGAKDSENIKKAYKYANIWMLIFWGVSTAICMIFHDQLLGIFINDAEGVNTTNALAAGYQRMTLMCLTYWLDGIMDIDGCYLRGMKLSLPPAIITLLGCTGTRLLFLWCIFPLETFHTIYWLYAAFPISWILVCLVYIPVRRWANKKVFKKLDEEKNLSVKIA